MSSKRGRNTTTRGTGCQYSVLAKESLDKTTWTLKHRTDKRFSTHNHELSQHPSAHPVEPLRIESRLQSSSIPKINTRREPSQFEVVQRALSTCSKCHRAGHIMTSRKCPLRYSELQSQPPSAPSASPVPSVPAVSSVPLVPSASSTPLAPGAPYDSPQAVYQRYTASRRAWYAAQPRGSIDRPAISESNGSPIAIRQNELRMVS